MGNAFDNASHPMFDLGGGNYGGIDPALLGYTHYVSNVGVATWANATEITTPCSITTAVAQATPGSVVGVRGGTYDVGNNGGGDLYNGAIQITISGTQASPIIFKAYEGEVPVFDGTIVGSGDWGANGNVGCRVLAITGPSLKEYITLDGFVFQSDGGVEMAGIVVGDDDGNDGGPSSQNVQYITVQNCTLKGGSNTPALQDNSAAIRLNKSNNCSILNNRFENYTNSNPSYVDSYPMGILSYSGYDHTIANNEFYDSVIGVGMKSWNNGWDIFNNYFYQCRTGVKGYTATHFCSNVTMYNNLFVEFADVGSKLVCTDQPVNNTFTPLDNMVEYNNTYYTANVTKQGLCHHKDKEGSSSGAVGFKLYNNLFDGDGNVSEWRQVTTDNYMVGDVIDYNMHATGTFSARTHNPTVQYNSDANFAAYLAVTVCGIVSHDVNSFIGTPVYENGSGNMDQIADFALAAGSPGKDADSLGNDIGVNTAAVGIQ